MNKTSNQTKLKFRQTVRSKQFISGVVLSFIIIAAPFLFYLHRFAPTEKVWETSYFTITSGGYNTVQGYIYIISTKIFIFIILSIWFLTCKYWWRYAISVPLTILVFQISSIINDKYQAFDEFDFITSLPVTIPIIVLHFLIAKKLNNKKINKLDALDRLDEELQAAIKTPPKQ